MSLTDKILDTVVTIGQNRLTQKANAAANAPVPPSAAPRIVDPSANAVPPESRTQIPSAPMPNQWKIWAGGSLALGAVLAFAVLALRRPRG